MSFDLWISNKKGATNLPVDRIKDWFSSRKHYDPAALNANQAFYDNPDTGVYFIIEFADPLGESDLSPLEQSVCACLLVNYLRPIFFAREAALEIQEFVNHFSLLTCDPQEDEEEFTDFNAEKFVSSFTKHSRWALNSMISNHNFEPKFMNGIQLDAIWAWNFEKENLQNSLQEDIFVPMQLFVERGNQVTSAVIWSDAIPTLIPPTDLILLSRTELAPKKLMFFPGDSQFDIFKHCKFEKILSEFYTPFKDRTGCFSPKQLTAPRKLIKAIKAFKTREINFELLRSDAVIDVEISTES